MDGAAMGVIGVMFALSIAANIAMLFSSMFNPKPYEWPTLEFAVYNSRIYIEMKHNGESRNSYHIELVKLRPHMKKFFPNLQPANGPVRSSIWHVLGMMPSTRKDDVLAAYKRMVKVYHPDCGGTSKAFTQLTEARDKALAKCN